MITKLMGNKNNFPRISVETLNTPTVSDIGMGSSEQVQTATLKIIVWSVRDLICTVNSVTDESHTYDPLIDTYELDELPVSDITSITGTMDGIDHIFIRGTDYTILDSDGDGMRDSVNWIVDTPDDSTDFLVTYKRVATGAELCRFIAQNINTYLLTWREWTNRKYWGYKLTSSNPLNLDENIGLYKYEMSVEFEGINIGDIV